MSLVQATLASERHLESVVCSEHEIIKRVSAEMNL